jgi:glycosyltransferase involved in cell wall biosynthesis
MFGEDAAVLVPPEDPLAVRDAIVRLLENAPLRRSLAATARRRLQERFTLSKMLEGYVSVYQSLTAARRDGYRRDAKERDGGKTGGKTAEQRSPV